MAKTKRGKGLWNVPSKGRGTCPICLSTRIKLLYTVTNSEGKQVTVCKKCSSVEAKVADKAVNTVNLAFRGKHRRVLNQQKQTV
ncbi:hypothetical protein AB4Z30_08750 [Paenibacillus sp. 2TAF8]|jgi:ribosome-binding protein aMBF1 (putative translation factor)|uniref:hypothetical protein n=1 Tax=Paenibacillus sp. 2TAF8 TaxID=3233020 RepID=UPI003F973FE8